MKRFFLHLSHWIAHMSLKWVIVIAVAAYLGLTFTSPFSDRHVLLNLEPYPDGVFYLNAAQNIARHGKFSVTYQDFNFQPIITPLYAYVLALGFLVTSNPGVFYVINVILGAVSLIALILTLKLISPRPEVVFLGILIYFSHVMLLWLPSLPMAENVVLSLFITCLYSYFRFLKNKQWWELAITIILICGLVFSKYTLVGPAAVLALAVLVKLIAHKSWQQLGWSLALFILAAGLFMFTQLQSGFNPLFLFITIPVERTVPQLAPVKQVFYSSQFMVPNLTQYAKSLVGVFTDVGRFLWLRYPLTTIGLVGTFLVGLSWLAGKGQRGSLLFLWLFLSQFPILLIFYVADQRYLILTAPLLAVGLSYLVSHVKAKARGIVTVLITLSVLLQLWTQLPLLRMLIADNWLHRSVAWQYEAVKVFNTQLPSESYVITVLPPILVDFYSEHHYSLLPLSQKQEFLDKKQFIWGNQLNYENLLATYQELLAEGKAVYVTNAYLSSQHEFEPEFKAIFEAFETKEVASGCFGTCNLYQLHLKSSAPAATLK
jgi:hypothetical protein